MLTKEVIEQIRSLKGVRAASLRAPSTQHGQPYLRVVTNPVVIESVEGERFYVPSVTFDIATGKEYAGAYSSVKWSSNIPHPCFSASGSAQYGSSVWPITEALRREDYMAAVFLITGFLSSFPELRVKTTELIAAKRLRKGWVTENG